MRMILSRTVYGPSQSLQWVTLLKEVIWIKKSTETTSLEPLFFFAHPWLNIWLRRSYDAEVNLARSVNLQIYFYRVRFIIFIGRFREKIYYS